VFSLYLITDGDAPQHIPSAVAAALSCAPPGRIAVQLRAKQADERTLLELARVLRSETRRRGAMLLINEHLDIAQRVAAEGVQLPERSISASEARERLGPSACIGLSCHDAAGLARAQGASFACLSPVFASPGKGQPLGLDRFGALIAHAELPVFALGGIRPEHARELRVAGAAGLAAISAVFAQPDPARAVTAFLESWDRAG
jgi:thiamine-phosphate pyrophosphorylase